MLRGSACAVFYLAVAFCPIPVSSLACGPTSILIRGRAENAPSGGSVSVKLVYEKGKVGESDRLLLDGATFRTRIQLSTFPHMKCARQPLQAVIALIDGEEEIDRVTLSVSQDFTLADPAELVTRHDVLLRGKKETRTH